MSFAICAGLAKAQPRKEIFDTETPITWLGLDFTRALFIGDQGRFSNESDIHNFMRSINMLMLDERDKYNIRKTFKKAIVTDAIDITLNHNATLKTETMVSLSVDDYLHLSEELIREIVAGYDYGERTGIGLMFNVESFDKPSLRGALWVTFIDLDDKSVLFTRRMQAKPVGFGLRNFWAGCVHAILKRIEKQYYKKWKKEYGETD